MIYQRALSLESGEQGIDYGREVEMPLYYKPHEVRSGRADFVVEGKGLAELKGLIGVEAVLVARALNLLGGYRLPVGLLINFRATRLEFKRLYRKEHPVHP